MVQGNHHNDGEERPSQIDPAATLHRDAQVTASILAAHVIVGDFSRVQHAQLEDYVKIDRRNLIQHSRLGRLTYTGASTVVQWAEIGSFNSISWGVTIGGGQHNVARLTTHDFLYEKRYGLCDQLDVLDDRYRKSCVLGHDVWVGANATILRGVSVGHGAVIGAGAVVTRDVPPYAIVAGNSAEILRFRFSEPVIERLLKLQWWDFDLTLLKEHAALFTSLESEAALEQLERLVK